MKINKVISLIVIFFVALFSVNLEVDAAQELTCMYKKEKYEWLVGKNKVLLVQYANGDTKLFTNAKDASIDEDGWVLRDRGEYVYNDALKYGDLQSCPGYIDTANNNKVYFYINSKVGRAKLDDVNSLNVAKEPSNFVTSSDLNNDLSSEETCSNDSWIKELDTSKHSGACLYKRELTNGNCHLVQINYGKDNVETTEYDSVKGVEYSGVKATSGSYSKKYLNLNLTSITVGFNVKFTLDEFLSKNNGGCLPAIMVDRDVQLYDDLSLKINTDVYLGSAKGDTYHLVNKKGENPITGDEMANGINTNISIGKKQVENCADLLGEEMADILGTVWNVIKMLVPLILLVLGTLDFAKAIFSGNEDGMKKAQAKFIKRVIIAVIIFLIPSLFGFILGVANDIWGNIGTDICGILA